MSTIAKIRMFLCSISALFFLIVPLGIFLNKGLTPVGYGLTTMVGFFISWAFAWPIAGKIYTTYLKNAPIKEDDAWQMTFALFFAAILILDLYAAFVLPFAQP